MEISKDHKRLLSRAGFQIMGAIDLLDFIIEDLKELEVKPPLLWRIMHTKNGLEAEAIRISKTLKEDKK